MERGLKGMLMGFKGVYCGGVVEGVERGLKGASEGVEGYVGMV